MFLSMCVSILSEPADLTIPLVTRYLMETVQTTDPLDLDAHMKFLRTIKYLESNSSSARVLLQGVLKGSDGSFKKLITKFASLIPTSEDTLAPIHLLHGFLDHAGQKDAIDRDFIIAIIRHSPLITNIFDVMRRLGKPRVADSLSQDSDFLVYEQVFQFLYKCISWAYLYCGEECPRLVVLWVRTDIFGALDQCLPRLISRPFFASTSLLFLHHCYHAFLVHIPHPYTNRLHLSARYCALCFAAAHHPGSPISPQGASLSLAPPSHLACMSRSRLHHQLRPRLPESRSLIVAKRSCWKR